MFPLVKPRGRVALFIVALALLAVLLATYNLRISRASSGVASVGAPSLAVSSQSSNIIQVTTEPGGVAYTSPTVATLSLGPAPRIRAVWVTNQRIRTATSLDGGETWSSASLVQECCWNTPRLHKGGSGRLWLVAVKSGWPSQVWAFSSSDEGNTWSPGTKINTGGEYADWPDVWETADSRVWVVWSSLRGGREIWYRVSADGGNVWGPETQLTSGQVGDYHPTIAQAADGRIWVVWYRSWGDASASGLWYRTTTDGGATWSSENQLFGGTPSFEAPSLGIAEDGTMWLSATGAANVWYWSSTDNGATWSGPTQFTRFVGRDWGGDWTALGGSQMGLVWASDRTGTFQVWFGVPGLRRRHMSRTSSTPPGPTRTTTTPSPSAPGRRTRRGWPCRPGVDTERCSPARPGHVR
jgi:hypothetical protein